MRLLLEKSDTFGAIASFLCMVHCILTPFVMCSQAMPSMDME